MLRQRKCTTQTETMVRLNGPYALKFRTVGAFLQASQALSSSGRWQKASGGLWPGVVPSARNNLRGASELLEECSSIPEGPGPWSTGLLTMSTQVIGHESTAAGKH